MRKQQQKGMCSFCHFTVSKHEKECGQHKHSIRKACCYSMSSRECHMQSFPL